MEFEPTALPEVILIKPRVFEDAARLLLRDLAPGQVCGAPASSRSSCRTTTATRRVIRCAGCIFRSSSRRASSCGSRAAKRSMWRLISAAAHLALGNGWVQPKRDPITRCCGCRRGLRTATWRSATWWIFCTSAPTSMRPQHERAIRWDDPQLGIRWPLPAGITPLLSAADAEAPLLQRRGHFPVKVLITGALGPGGPGPA